MAFAGYPLIVGERLVGVMAMFSRQAVSDLTLRTMSSVANKIALAIDRKRTKSQVNDLQHTARYLQEEIQSEHNFEELFGASPSMLKVFRHVDTVAATDSTVLVTGETGTGKELIARAIHNRSKRKEKILVKVNCAALPAGLIESELFGHEKGAFTGALTRKVGRFELADGGTLLLDGTNIRHEKTFRPSARASHRPSEYPPLSGRAGQECTPRRCTESRLGAYDE